MLMMQNLQSSRRLYIYIYIYVREDLIDSINRYDIKTISYLFPLLSEVKGQGHLRRRRHPER